MSTHMISCLTWIPKGAPKTTPDLYELDEQVLKSLNQGISNGMKLGAGMDDEGNGSDIEDVNEEEDVLKALNMDAYDDDEPELGQILGNNYVDLEADEDYEDEEDVEHQTIRSQDSCIIVGNTTEEDSIIEIYIFDEETNNLYVHHDFKLPSFPLSLAWMAADPRSNDADSIKKGSFVAVGTFNPNIEIWNCDVMNPIEPLVVLGGIDEEATKKAMEDAKKKKKANLTSKGKKNNSAFVAPIYRPDSHQDAVMCLSWNPNLKHILASGSADHTIKLWDITSKKCVTTLTHHADKVQSLEWNPVEHYILLSGAYDRTVCVTDIRTPNNVAKVTVSADIECVRWNTKLPYLFVAATEDGYVTCYDVRDLTKPVWRLAAHEKTTSCIAYNQVIPTMFATGSIDEMIKIWDTTSGVPVLVAQRHLDLGKLFTLQFDVSSPFVLACGGDGGALGIWDIMENYKVNEMYKNLAKEMNLGDHTLPKDYIEMQKQGIEGKGLGPGKEGSGVKTSHADSDQDSDSEDEDEEETASMRMSMYKPTDEGDMNNDEEEYEEDDEDNMQE